MEKNVKQFHALYTAFNQGDENFGLRTSRDGEVEFFAGHDDAFLLAREMQMSEINR